MRTDGNGNGTRRPHEIQAEIERTRHDMDGTLSAIENRLTPGQLYDQGMQYLRNSGGTEFLSNLGEQAKGNPMPVALVGIGLAWLMATGRTGSAAQPGYDSSGPGIRARASQAKDKLDEIRDTTRQQMDRAKGQLDTLLHEQPLALGAVGLAVGALAAALAPRTAQEEQLAGKIDAVTNPQSGAPQQDALKKARDDERERLQQGVKPYAERNETEPPV